MSSPESNDGDGLATARGPGKRALRRAWIAVILIPVTFMVAMVAGEGLAAAAGYPSGEGDGVPLGTRLLIGLPLTLLMVAPALLAALWGFRAKREGEAQGSVAGYIGLVVAAYIVLVTAVGLIFGP